MREKIINNKNSLNIDDEALKSSSKIKYTNDIKNKKIDLIENQIQEIHKKSNDISESIDKNTELHRKNYKKIKIIIPLISLILVIILSIFLYNVLKKELDVKMVIPITLSNPSTIFADDVVEYIVSYPADKKIENIKIQSSDVVLYGFDAHVEIISKKGMDRIVRLTDIVKNQTYNTYAYIGLKSETAYDIKGNAVSGILESKHFIIKAVDNIHNASPTISFSDPSKTDVELGGEVEYMITFAGAEIIQFESYDVLIAGKGVTCDVEIINQESDNQKNYEKRIVKLTNIHGEVGSLVSIALRSGIAANNDGQTIQTPKTIAFKIIE